FANAPLIDASIAAVISPAFSSLPIVPLWLPLPFFLNRTPAIHVERNPGNHRGSGRAKESRSFSQIVGFQQAAHRNGIAEVFADFLGVLTHESGKKRRFTGNRVQRHHTNFRRSQLDGERLGDRNHPALGGIVPGKVRTRATSAGRGDVEDYALAIALEMRDELAGHQVDAAYIDAENAVEFLRLDQFGILRLVADAGIVDQNIDLAELRQGSFHRRMDIGFPGDIGSNGQGRLAYFA